MKSFKSADVTRLAATLSILATTGCVTAAYAADNGTPANTKSSIKTAPTGQKTGFSKEEKKVPVTSTQKKANAATATAANAVPGVKLDPKNLEVPPEEPAIHGFHPIKKMLAPVVRLERNSVQLQQQIMKLEGPIAGLNSPMVGLQKHMVTVEGKMDGMQGELSKMRGKVDGVNESMTNVRGDITAMRKEIAGLLPPINAMRGPIEKLEKPLINVAEPLTEVKGELQQMKALLATVLGAVILGCVAIAVGTPFAGFMVYRHRHKLFPGLRDSDMPVIKTEKEAKSDAQEAGVDSRLNETRDGKKEEKTLTKV